MARQPSRRGKSLRLSVFIGERANESADEICCHSANLSLTASMFSGSLSTNTQILCPKREFNMRYFARFLPALVLAMFATGAVALDFPRAECTLNEDKSTVEVVASNGGTEKWVGYVQCLVKSTKTGAFQLFDCRYNVTGGQAPETVCTLEGDGANSFSDILTKSAQWVPR